MIWQHASAVILIKTNGAGLVLCSYGDIGLSITNIVKVLTGMGLYGTFRVLMVSIVIILDARYANKLKRFHN